MEHKILFVDDDAHILDAYRRQLRKQFHVETALGGDDALAEVQRHNDPDYFAVVVADMRMPKMDGVEFLSRLRVMAPNTVRIMLTGNADQQTAIDAVNEGYIYRFLNKPCPPEVLAKTLRGAINQYQLQIAEKELLEKTLTGSIRLVTDLISMADPAAYARAIKLRNYVREVSEHLNSKVSTNNAQISTWELELAAMLSRIGLIALPIDVQRKIRAGHSLTDDEAEAISRVPAIGSDLMRRIPRLGSVAEIIKYQGEMFDAGLVSPDSELQTDSRISDTERDAIPTGARLIKILADLVEVESGGIGRGEAMRILKGRSGFYDPRLLLAVTEYFSAAGEAPDVPARSHSGIQIPLFVRDLQPGDRLIENVVSQDGSVLFPAGHIVTSGCVQSLTAERETKGVCEPVYIVPG